MTNLKIKIRSIKLLGEEWEEVKKSEYKKIKKQYPATANSFTMRVRHRFFKLKELHPLVKEFDRLFEKILDDNENFSDFHKFRYKLKQELQK